MRAAIAAMLLLASSSAFATGSTAGFETGGRFVRFDPVVAQYNMSGELFRIDGICKSACTLFPAIRNVCVTRNATFYFHAGHDRQRNITASATSHMIGAYDEGLRNWRMKLCSSWRPCEGLSSELANRATATTSEMFAAALPLNSIL